MTNLGIFALFAVAVFGSSIAFANDVPQSRDYVIVKRREFPSYLKEDEKSTIVINECFDFIIDEINAIIPNGFDVPGGTLEFTQDIFGIELHGAIFFENGNMHGFNTFVREGDATAEVSLGGVDVRAGLGLASLTGGFNAGIEFNGLDWTIEPSFELNVGVTLGVLIAPGLVTLSELGVHINGWDFNLPGLDIIASIEEIIIGWLLELLGDFLIGLFQDTIIGDILDQIQAIVEGEFDICSAIVPQRLFMPHPKINVHHPFMSLPRHISRKF